MEELQLAGIDCVILELSLANSRCLSSDKMLFLPCNEIVSLFWCTHIVFYLSLHLIPGICCLSSRAKSLEWHVLLLKRFREPENLRYNKIAIYAKVVVLLKKISRFLQKSHLKLRKHIHLRPLVIYWKEMPNAGKIWSLVLFYLSIVREVRDCGLRNWPGALHSSSGSKRDLSEPTDRAETMWYWAWLGDYELSL